GDHRKFGGSTPCKGSCVNITWSSFISRKGFHNAQQLRNLSTARNGFCRVESMFDRVFIPLWCSRGLSPVHPAPPIRHRGCLARVPAPRSSSASRAEVHG